MGGGGSGGGGGGGGGVCASCRVVNKSMLGSCRSPSVSPTLILLSTGQLSLSAVSWAVLFTEKAGR